MVLCAIICMLISANVVSSSIVSTTHGPIEGSTITLFNGKNIDTFLGVPYAAPPVGRLRFSAPQPLEPWKETLSTKTFSKGCLQFAPDGSRKNLWFISELEEGEDCLYLNIWKPQVTTEKKLAVMIFIIGGGFLAGATSMPIYNPSVLASENDVIVATLNYRLAQYGFLYLNDNLTPGNAGLQDQIQAIKWITDNIEAFGGDPKRVTLFGESAGGTSINYHLLNKEISPVFQNAILESGTYNIPILSCSKQAALQNTLDMAKRVGCPVEDLTKTFDCLTKADIVDLQNNSGGIFNSRGLVYCPVRNGAQVPLDTLTAAKNIPDDQKKNVLNGNVPRELMFLFTELFLGKSLTEDVRVSLEEFMGIAKNVLMLSDERLQSILQHEYKNFDGSCDPSQFRIDAISALSDCQMICPMVEFAKQWISTKTQMYYFEFDHRPSKPLKYSIPEWVGTLHGDEIPFVLGAPLDPKKGYSEEDKKMSKIIMDYWTTFAKTGNPNGKNQQQTQWPPLTQNGQFTQLRFQNGVTVEPFMRERQCDFWFGVYPNLLSVQSQLKGVAKR